MLIAPMSPAQKAFVEKLDREHDKIESFYLAREKEARTQASRLRSELNELKQHRALFHVRIIHTLVTRAHSNVGLANTSGKTSTVGSGADIRGYP